MQAFSSVDLAVGATVVLAVVALATFLVFAYLFRSFWSVPVANDTSAMHPGEYVEWLRRLIHDKSLPNAIRARLAGASFGYAMEHHHSITLLSEHRLYGSAFSLLRPAYEAYCRGAWLWYKASDDQISTFQEGRGAPKLDRMLRSLENVPGFGAGVLSQIKREHWKTFSDPVHSGISHLMRWQTDDTIEPSYTDAEADELARLAEVYGTLSAVQILEMGGHTQEVEEVVAGFTVRHEPRESGGGA